MKFEEASEVLFPFINDAPCLNEFIISEITLDDSKNFMIKVMEKEDNDKIINVLYSKRKNFSFNRALWLKDTENFERFLALIKRFS